MLEYIFYFVINIIEYFLGIVRVIKFCMFLRFGKWVKVFVVKYGDLSLVLGLLKKRIYSFSCFLIFLSVCGGMSFYI